MGKNSSKIDQDTARTVKQRIFKNNSFRLKKNTTFEQKLQKLLFFKILRFTVFAVSWSIFVLFLPILPFWNSQRLIFKMAHSMLDLST